MAKMIWPKDAKAKKYAEVKQFMTDTGDEKTIGKISKDELKLGLTIDGIELDPVKGGATSATATVLAAGPTGQFRKRDATPGWYSANGAATVEAAKGKRWSWVWNNTVWTLWDMGDLPRSENEQSLTSSDPNKALAANMGPAIQELVSQRVAKTSLFNYSRNLINKSDPDVALGKYLGGSGQLVNGSYNTTGFIKIDAGQSYAISPNPRFGEYYDANKQYVGTLLNWSTSSNQVVLAPTGAVYIRISYSSANWTTAQLELGTAVTAYVPYGEKVKDALLPTPSIEDNSVVTSKIKNAAVTAEKTDFIVNSKNLFNKATVVNGFFISNTGQMTSSNGLSASYFIAVKPSTEYLGSRSGGTPLRMYCFYNENREVVSGGSNNSATGFTTTASTYYVRITVYTPSLNDTMLREAGTDAGYVPYGKYISQQILGFEPSAAVQALNWTNEGDSNTDSNKWQPSVASALNLVSTKLGIAGTRLSGTSPNAMWQDARTNLFPLNTQLVTLLAGTNDWANNAPLGDANSTDTTTFWGAFNVWVQKVATRCPTAKIFICLTPIGQRIDKPSSWANNFTNQLGLRTTDYAKVLREGAFKYGLPVIDFSSLGWNEFNISQFVPDGLHPDGIGVDQMSREAIAVMRDRIR